MIINYTILYDIISIMQYFVVSKSASKIDIWYLLDIDKITLDVFY